MAWVFVILGAVCALDLLVFFVGAIKNLPTGFTEWVCYPFYPFISDGFGMFTAMIIRLVEVIFVIIGAISLGSILG